MPPPGPESVQGYMVRVPVPVLVGTANLVQTVSTRVLIDLTTRFIVLTETAAPMEGMLFSIEHERATVAETKVGGTTIISQAECVTLLSEFLASKPDVDLVGVFFPFMDYVRQGELRGESHPAICLYNAAAEEGTSSAVMVANFLPGYHVPQEQHRIPLQAVDFRLDGHVAPNSPPISPGDVDVVKLFSLPESDANGNATYWDWKKNKRSLKLRHGPNVRTEIVSRLLAMAKAANPLEYVEVDREKSGKVRASQVFLEECRDGQVKRVQRVVMMQSGV